jgi:PAS domain S-box-containing protein
LQFSPPGASSPAETALNRHFSFLIGTMTVASRQDSDDRQLAILIDDMPFVGMALLAPDGAQWLRVNGRLCEMLAYSRDELLATAWPRLVHTDDLAPWLDRFEQLRSEILDAYTIEQRLVDKHGESVESLVNLRRIRSPESGTSCLILTVSEIGGRRQAEKALRTANERLTRAQHAAGAGLWDWDMLADKLEWSGELFQLFGLDPARDTPSFETWHGIVHCDDLGAATEQIQHAIQNHTPLSSEYRVILPSLDIRWISALGDTSYDAEGRPVRMSGICLDITARKQANAVLRAERDRSQRYLDTVETVIVALDATGRITLLNRKGLALLGYAAGELDGENWFERCLPAPEGATRVYPIFRQLMAGEMANAEYVENSVLTCTGEQRLIAWRNTLLHDDLGRISGVLSAGEDITERRLAENALRYQLDLNRNITDKATDSIFINDAQGRVTFVNPEGLRVFGYSEAELLGQRLHDVIHHTREDGQAYPMHACPLCQVYANGRVIRDHATIFFRKDGSPVHVTASNAALEANGKPAGAVLVLHDVTASRRNEQALRESEARLQLATEIGRSGTWDWDIASGEVIWSRGHFEILGYQMDAVKPSFQAWADRVHPEDLANVEAGLRRSMAERQDYAAEFRIVWPDASVHWMSARGRFDYAENGACTRMLGVMADVTGMKKAELDLLDANRRKDEFLAMLAHELRNPLAPIRNAAHVLRRLQLDEPRVRWAQEIIERQVAHLSRLVDDLLDVSRIVRGKVNLRVEPIDLPVLVRHAIESTRPLMDAMRHQLHVQLPSTPVPLEGDPTRLLQVLVNLLDNAAKYTRTGGQIALNAEVQGGWLEIALRDNGLGMSPELLPRVFDLFSQGERTLDRAQGGLGIGLTLVRNLIEMHGGEVAAASPGPGRGATFTLRLPLCVPPDGALPEPADERTGLRILIVDDDPAVAESMAMFLEMEGHTTLTAASGEAALELLAEFRPRIVLLDLGLPGLDGYTVARRIRQQPNGDQCKLIAVSGYGNEEVIGRCLAVGFDRHLLKPLDPAALSAFLADFRQQA